MLADPAAVKALFLEAAAIDDPVARAALLNERCRDDAALLARVNALLVANDQAVANEGTASFGAADGSADAEPTAGLPGQDEHVGSVLAGKYKLIEAIGEGGMGSVYMAQQTEPVKRAVAVKVIKAGMDSKAVLARFEAERQALAMMDHPNIARVLDAGTTDGGRPFFVMELVKGTPITQYCDERKLTPRQRLELFVPVCQAIQHAHQKGIIHRDIKPSNVLVALYDDLPVPKVIDFGLAKAAGQLLTDKTLMTGFAALVGTPEYMSPEQASLNNLDIDTRSDVYSLGVLLYELLTGSTPVDRKSLGKAALLEILRIVREVEAPRPSAKLSSSDTLPSVAANRGTEPAKLSKLMKGELDWVLLKALEKDRTRRYDTANALSRDIQRYLADEVVEARPPSAGYRLKKFVRRHKGQVLAASLVLFALLGGTAGTTWGFIRAENRRVEAEAARAAEADRVTERDEALGKRDTALGEAKTALDKAGEALRNEAERVKERDKANNELNQQLGNSNFLLALAAYDKNDLAVAADRLGKVPLGERGWEWAYLKQQMRGLFTLYGHKGIVSSVSFSPDGTRIVTGGGQYTRFGEAKVWDARTGTPLLELKGHTGIVTSVSFSPDGTRIVTGSYDRTAKVWDARTGTPLLDLKGHTDQVYGVSFSPDGARIVTGSADQTAKVWDARTGTPLLDLKGHTGAVSSVSFSPDGTRIVTGSVDQTAKVWDARTGTPLLELKGHTSYVSSVSFSPDETRIVTGGGEFNKFGEVKVWDARTGTPLFDLKGQTHTIMRVSFSPDGARIITGSYDQTAKVWDARTGIPLLDLKGHTNQVMSLSFSPDGTRIVTGGGEYNKFGEAKVWDARTGMPLLDLKGHTGAVRSVSFSPDGTRIVTGSVDQTAKVWDARTGTPLLDLKGHMALVTSVSFSPDGTRIVTGSWDQTAKVWDARTGTPLLDLKGHTGVVYSVSFSPDGTRIVTGSDDKTAKVWDARTGTPLLDLKGHTGQVMSVSFSPDGTRIVTGGSFNTKPAGEAKVWDARTGMPLLDLKGHTLQVQSVSFSPDGTRIVTGGGTYNKPGEAKVWDARTGMPLLDLKGHTGAVMSVSFSPDGTRIVTGGGEYNKPGEAKVWDARTGQELTGDPKRDAEELEYRLFHTRPNYRLYAEGYDAARQAKDPFAARFYLDRILSLPEQRTTARFAERNALQADPLVIARTGFHHPALAKAPYDRGTVALLAVHGDRLAKRIVAQELLRDGKPGPAIPLLVWCLASRPATSPPVEELLLAQAYLDLKQPDEAKRFCRAATDWLDRPRDPKDNLGVGFAPNGDPRRNPFDWEVWHECDVFRAEVERRLAGIP